MALIASLAVGGVMFCMVLKTKKNCPILALSKCGGLDFRYEGLYVST